MTNRSRWLAVAAGILILAGSASHVAAGDRFSLAIGSAINAGLSPAAEQSLALWNSPMGRVAAAVNLAQSDLGMSGLVGHPYGVAIAIGFRPQLRPELISAAVQSGIELSARELTPIHWPWEKKTSGENGDQPLSLEEQISRLLGQRLELR